MVPGSNMNKLIFANLLHRPMRSVISVLAVAIEVIMILSIVAIFMGMLIRPETAHQRHRRRSDAVALERQLVQWNRQRRPCRSKTQEVLRKLPHVAVVSPAIQKISTSGSVEILYGIDYDELRCAQAVRLSRWRQVSGTERRHHRRRFRKHQKSCNRQTLRSGRLQS